MKLEKLTRRLTTIYVSRSLRIPTNLTDQKILVL